jgi:hypothetical protein
LKAKSRDDNDLNLVRKSGRGPAIRLFLNISFSSEEPGNVSRLPKTELFKLFPPIERDIRLVH